MKDKATNHETYKCHSSFIQVTIAGWIYISSAEGSGKECLCRLPPTGLYRHDTCDTTMQRMRIWHWISSQMAHFFHKRHCQYDSVGHGIRQTLP